MNVTFIGLGLMGKPIAINLLKAGINLTVVNRSQGKVEELGKQIAGIAHKFKEGKDDVMTMADEMITNGAMPDPEMIKMLEK